MLPKRCLKVGAKLIADWPGQIRDAPRLLGRGPLNPDDGWQVVFVVFLDLDWTKGTPTEAIGGTDRIGDESIRPLRIALPIEFPGFRCRAIWN